MLGSDARARPSVRRVGRPADRTRGDRGAGDIAIEDATFPGMDRVRPALARFGLRPPNEDAAPARASVVATEWGLLLSDLRVDLHGASLRGQLAISRERVLDGHAEVTLEEEYLRTSKVLTLPRVFSERLIIPVRIGGHSLSRK